MIGPSDLYRIPRWTPGRRSEDVRRYAKLELGAESVGSRVEVQHQPRLLGLRVWVASHVRFARPAVSAAQPEPLRTGVAAVHFEGEAHHVHSGSEILAKTEGPCAAFETAAMVFGAPEHGRCLDEPHACEN